MKIVKILNVKRYPGRETITAVVDVINTREEHWETKLIDTLDYSNFGGRVLYMENIPGGVKVTADVYTD